MATKTGADGKGAKTGKAQPTATRSASAPGQGVEPDAVAWLVERLAQDPRFLDRLYAQESSAGQERDARPDGERDAIRPEGQPESFDAVLRRLGEALGSTIPGPLPQPGTDYPPRPRPGTTPLPPPPAPGLDRCAVQRMLAEELHYLQVIPPVTLDMMLDVPDLVRRFIESMKQMRVNPDLAAAILPQPAAGPAGDRNIDDPELAELLQRMARDLTASGDDDDRIAPLALVAGIGAAAGVICAGVVVGRAIGQALK